MNDVHELLISISILTARLIKILIIIAEIYRCFLRTVIVVMSICCIGYCILRQKKLY